MSHPNEDPLVTSSRREAIIVTVFFLAAMAYTLTYCGLYGYGPNAVITPLVFGFPHWIFYGVIVPWVACTIVSIAYALIFITNDPLGEAAENWNPEGADQLPGQEQSHA
jgi:hypothetical protein